MATLTDWGSCIVLACPCKSVSVAVSLVDVAEDMVILYYCSPIGCKEVGYWSFQEKAAGSTIQQINKINSSQNESRSMGPVSAAAALRRMLVMRHFFPQRLECAVGLPHGNNALQWHERNVFLITFSVSAGANNQRLWQRCLVNICFPAKLQCTFFIF